jgi:hypothetical protein
MNKKTTHTGEHLEHHQIPAPAHQRLESTLKKRPKFPNTLPNKVPPKLQKTTDTKIKTTTLRLHPGEARYPDTSPNNYEPTNKQTQRTHIHPPDNKMKQSPAR